MNQAWYAHMNNKRKKKEFRHQKKKKLGNSVYLPVKSGRDVEMFK
jgi:hypothetical protein